MPKDTSSESIPSSLVDKLNDIDRTDPSEREQAWKDLLNNTSAEEREFLEQNTSVRGGGRDVQVMPGVWRRLDFEQSEARKKAVQGPDDSELEE